ncbi:hypothetical protein RM780_09895 [Streptomyces sp. DSM 44917]|uniref:ATP/GTP-binding protein n=1 Tax=Streptomyces boetiae TaxID=3075541 RepID=A0ABU2L6S5_9ACTN|nr:hypothetical protein [Streptomyces sp. DSM 44917]MDT0307274.1 hypothetical protein [Streptomyces sp. DSM 44917]
MLRRILARAAAGTVGAAAVVAGAVAPAVADDGWGSVDCEQNPRPGCELGAGEGQPQVPAPGGGGGGAPAPAPEDGGGRGEAEEPEYANDDLNLADCAYEPAPDFRPPAEATATAFSPALPHREVARAALADLVTPAAEEETDEDEPGQGEGAWYVYRCSGEGVRDALYRPPVWIPDAQDAEEAAGPSPAQLAEQAREQLRLPAPEIAASPAGDQLVRVPTWLWLEPGSWEEISATASVPGVSVTAVATPRSVTWSMGDGSEVVCSSPGTPYEAGGAPGRSSPDCGHTYTDSSAGQPGDSYPVSAEVTWTVTWSGAGESGEFPGLTTSSSTSFRVLESQALTQ